MPEHWSEFFQSATPKQQERAGIRLSSTTDSQAQLDHAVSSRQAGEPESFIYTEIQPATPEQDGSIEHNEPRIVTDAPEAEDKDELLENMIVPLTPEQQAAANANYQVALIAARAALPDFDETLNQPEVQIPMSAHYMIRNSGIPNGPLVAYYLAKHRTECERLVHMSPKQVQARIVELSASLINNPTGVALDTAPYSTYRRVRNAAVRNMYR